MRDVWERRVLAALAWAFLFVVVFAATTLVLAGVRSIREGQPTCVTTRTVPAEVDCVWEDGR